MKKIYILLAITIGVLAISSVSQAYAGNCYSYASKKCVSNVVYWYDSCGSIQAVAQNCNTTNQVCSNGACIGNTTINNTQTTNNTQVQTYIQNYRTACYNNNIFWYDSNAVVQNMQKSCSDGSSCTVDSCTSSACKNTLKCDGSTCAANSADYISFCAGTGTTTPTNTNTQGNTNQGGITVSGQNQSGQVLGTQTQSGGLAVSLFVKKEADADWSKSVTTANGDKLNFMVVFKNTSGASADNATIQANLTNSISYSGNLKIDNQTAAGSIVSGINIGQLQTQTSKVVSFSGTVQSQNPQTIQASTQVSSGSMRDGDYVIVNVSLSNATAAVSSNGLLNFAKKWYLWAIIIIVLIILFVIIFRRLSTSA